MKLSKILMLSGLTGRLDSLYPQVMGPRNGWLGCDGDVWERGLYWIELIPSGCTTLRVTEFIVR